MLTLTAENVVLYLIKKGLYPEQDDHTVKITSLSGKNFNLRLQFANGLDLVVKQEVIIDDECDQDFLGESALQSLLRSRPELQPLQQLVPPITLYDPENAVLVCPFLTDYEDVSDYFHRTETPNLQLAQMMGEVLGQLHQRTLNRVDYRDQLFAIDDCINVKAEAPRSLGAIKRLTPEIFGRMRADAFGFYRWAQAHPEVNQALAQLRQQWRGGCVLHQDLKFSNWLWCEATGEIKLIDWEKVDWGDPLTDLADVLVAYIYRWLKSCAWEISTDLSTCLQTATLPLTAIQPSLQTLIRQYFGNFPQIAELHPDWINQTVQLMGRELIDRVLRDIQYHLPLGHQQAATLQLAQRLLCQPARASRNIFGTDFRAEFTAMEVAA